MAMEDLREEVRCELPLSMPIGTIVADYAVDTRGPIEFQRILMREIARTRDGRLVIAEVTYKGNRHPGKYTLIAMLGNDLHMRIEATFTSAVDKRFTKTSVWTEPIYVLWNLMMALCRFNLKSMYTVRFMWEYP
jgi:hypothetical protein